MARFRNTPGDSSFEAKVVHHLLHDLGLLEKPKMKRLPYIIKGTYLPDFILPNGVVIEVKGGYFPPVERRKMEAVINSNPGLDVRFVFGWPHQRQQRGKLMSPAAWCEKRGYRWAKKRVPIEWLEEDATT